MEHLWKRWKRVGSNWCIRCLATFKTHFFDHLTGVLGSDSRHNINRIPIIASLWPEPPHVPDGFVQKGYPQIHLLFPVQMAISHTWRIPQKGTEKVRWGLILRWFNMLFSRERKKSLGILWKYLATCLAFHPILNPNLPFHKATNSEVQCPLWKGPDPKISEWIISTWLYVYIERAKLTQRTWWTPPIGDTNNSSPTKQLRILELGARTVYVYTVYTYV